MKRKQNVWALIVTGLQLFERQLFSLLQHESFWSLLNCTLSQCGWIMYMKDQQQEFLEADSMAVDQDFCILLYWWEGQKSKFGSLCWMSLCNLFLRGKNPIQQEQKRALSRKRNQSFFLVAGFLTSVVCRSQVNQKPQLEGLDLQVLAMG